MKVLVKGCLPLLEYIYRTLLSSLLIWLFRVSHSFYSLVPFFITVYMVTLYSRRTENSAECPVTQARIINRRSQIQGSENNDYFSPVLQAEYDYAYVYLYHKHLTEKTILCPQQHVKCFIPAGGDGKFDR